jgi:hypothetical protein
MEDAWPAAETLDGARATAAAGLFFLVPLLDRLGIAAAVADDPALEDLPRRILLAVADRTRVPADDPVRLMLADDEEPPATPAVEAWTARLRRWCRVEARIGLYDLVRRPGRVAATRTHLDLTLPLAAADARVRAAGLDLDPGWVPWLGRVVAFHYED